MSSHDEGDDYISPVVGFGPGLYGEKRSAPKVSWLQQFLNYWEARRAAKLLARDAGELKKQYRESRRDLCGYLNISHSGHVDVRLDRVGLGPAELQESSIQPGYPLRILLEKLFPDVPETPSAAPVESSTVSGVENDPKTGTSE